VLAPRDGISASQQRATYAATKVEELAFVVGPRALRLYEAFNLLASGGRWYSRMKRLAFTTNTHDARAAL
jgi:hypothetical protein